MIFITRAQYINISAQILNYAEYHRKSESGAFASFFGREEWIENPVPDCFGNAYTIVGNGDLNLIVSLMGCYEHFAACRAGIACVVHKVHHDLQQFLRVTENIQLSSHCVLIRISLLFLSREINVKVSCMHWRTLTTCFS